MDKNDNKKENKTGKYIYDKNLKKVVKVSDDIVGLNKNSSNDTNNIPSCNSNKCCPGCKIN